jgi:uncharacterized membrane protein
MGRRYRWIWALTLGVVLLILTVSVLALFGVQASYSDPPFPFFPFGFWLIPVFSIFFFFVGKWYLWGWWYRPWYWLGYDDPKVILRERYARGEITREQFNQMISDLERGQ